MSEASNAAWGARPSAVLGDRYELGEELGSGAMGVVFRAIDRKTGAAVAVKVVHEAVAQDPAIVTRFVREAATLRRLRHPHTVSVLDFGQTDGLAPYLVMELLVGEPLSAVLDREGVLTVSRAVDLLLQVSDAVAEAHHEGIVHRDLKPENIFVLDGGARAKVVDFGVAKVLGGDGALTQTGIVLGTPLYIAPELSLGQSPHPPGDVYSLGVVLYEMLCGHPPFFADSYVELMLLQINKPPPPLPKAVRDVAGPHLLALLDRMLAKDPAERPADAAAVARGLREAIQADDAAAVDAEQDAVGRARRGTLQGAPRMKGHKALREAATALRRSAELQQFREQIVPEPITSQIWAGDPEAGVDLGATRPNPMMLPEQDAPPLATAPVEAQVPIAVDDIIEGVEPLRPGVPVRAVANHARWTVVAAGPKRGVVRPLRARDALPVTRSFDLESLDPALGPVRFRVHAEPGAVTWGGHIGCRIVTWENVTAWHHPRFLVRVLREILHADISRLEKATFMEPGDRLVWDARNGRARRLLGPPR